MSESRKKELRKLSQKRRSSKQSEIFLTYKSQLTPSKVSQKLISKLSLSIII